MCACINNTHVKVHHVLSRGKEEKDPEGQTNKCTDRWTTQKMYPPTFGRGWKSSTYHNASKL